MFRVLGLGCRQDRKSLIFHCIVVVSDGYALSSRSEGNPSRPCHLLIRLLLMIGQKSEALGSGQQEDCNPLGWMCSVALRHG